MALSLISFTQSSSLHNYLYIYTGTVALWYSIEKLLPRGIGLIVNRHKRTVICLKHSLFLRWLLRNNLTDNPFRPWSFTFDEVDDWVEYKYSKPLTSRSPLQI